MQIYLLAALSDHDDTRTADCLAWLGRSRPPAVAHARNRGYPILFVAHWGSNLSCQFCAQFVGRICFRSGFFSSVFHICWPLQSFL